MSILGTKGIKPDMEFKCCDCEEKFSGQDLIDRKVELHIVRVNKDNPIKSEFRCECCQDDYEEKYGEDDF